VRDGEEARVSYEKPFQSPPQLVLVECVRSGFAKVPFKKSDFQVVQNLASGFTIRSCHDEVKWSSWASVKWRAEGTSAREKPPASRTRKEELADRVKALGGTMTLDQGRPDAPIISLDLHRTRVTDVDLSLMEGLTSLRRLNLYGTGISESGPASLSGLTGLHVLHLNDTATTDASMQYLSGLTSLKELTLYHTRVTDQGLVYLGQLTSLQSLSLGGTGISDRGLQHLKTLRNRKELVLSGTAVTDAGIHDFKRALPRVRVIK
jgi:hypothetical protein